MTNTIGEKIITHGILPLLGGIVLQKALHKFLGNRWTWLNSNLCKYGTPLAILIIHLGKQLYDRSNSKINWSGLSKDQVKDLLNDPGKDFINSMTSSNWDALLNKISPDQAHLIPPKYYLKQDINNFKHELILKLIPNKTEKDLTDTEKQCLKHLSLHSWNEVLFKLSKKQINFLPNSIKAEITNKDLSKFPKEALQGLKFSELKQIKTLPSLIFSKLSPAQWDHAFKNSLVEIKDYASILDQTLQNFSLLLYLKARHFLTPEQIKIYINHPNNTQYFPTPQSKTKLSGLCINTKNPFRLFSSQNVSKSLSFLTAIFCEKNKELLKHSEVNETLLYSFISYHLTRDSRIVTSSNAVTFLNFSSICKDKEGIQKAIVMVRKSFQEEMDDYIERKKIFNFKDLTTLISTFTTCSIFDSIHSSFDEGALFCETIAKLINNEFIANKSLSDNSKKFLLKIDAFFVNPTLWKRTPLSVSKKLLETLLTHCTNLKNLRINARSYKKQDFSFIALLSKLQKTKTSISSIS